MPDAVFAAARRGDPLGRAVVEEVARRIAAHITPIAAVADPALVVLGGGLGTNGDLLLDTGAPLVGQRGCPTRRGSRSRALGEAAVLMGALAVGLRSALDNVFVNRPALPARLTLSRFGGWFQLPVPGTGAAGKSRLVTPFRCR